VSILALKDMFERMVKAKDASLIEHFYHPDFIMYSDGLEQDFAAFAASHRGVYDTAISYAIEYDEQAWVETSDRVAGRMWITTSRPDERPNRIEIVVIAAYLDGKIHRVWETTWPSWRTLDAFENY
jgi:hypothetical protein